MLRILFLAAAMTIVAGCHPSAVGTTATPDPVDVEAILRTSEWRVIRLSPDAVLMSYRISAPAMSWTAYATSVWQRRGDRWETVFHQASRARPATD